MREKSNEERAAANVLGFDEEGHDRPAAAGVAPDEATRQLEREMRETVAALREWRRQLEAQPGRLPQVRPRSSWAWPVGIAAALAIGFGFNFWAMYRGNSTAIVRELEWTTQPLAASENGPGREITVHIVPSELKSGGGPGGLAAFRRAGPAHPPPGLDPATAQDVRRRAAFPFHMPDRLSGALTLRSAETVGSNRVHLVYVGDSGTLAVFLSRSPGPDIAVRAVRIGERTLLAGRRHGVIAAFDAPSRSRPTDDWNVLLRDFANGDQAGG